jgi:hypothetical protein
MMTAHKFIPNNEKPASCVKCSRAQDHPTHDIRTIILARIGEERARAIRLKEQGRFEYTIADDGVSDGMRLAMIAEEVGEVARNIMAREGIVTDGSAEDSELFKELCQVAALSAGWMERLF